MNMYKWVDDIIASDKQKAMPVLSFPSIQKMGITVAELINDSDKQAECLKTCADNAPNAAAQVSFMDLSLEAEAFGSTIRVSDEEVPTVIGSIVDDEEAADALEIPEVGAKRTKLNIEAIEMADIMEEMPANFIAMGNVDPASQFRNGTPESIYARTQEVMEQCCKYPNFVISSGCDIPPMSPWENIDAFFKAVDDFYAK